MANGKNTGIGRCRGFEKDQKGVSPVIGTILMVAITVVLAGTLVVMIPRISPPQTNVMVGFITDIEGSDWVVKVLSVQQGTIGTDEAVVQVTNATTGAAMFRYPDSGRGIGAGDKTNFEFYDNNKDGMINSGDSFFVHANKNITAGHTFTLFKGGQSAGETKLL